MDGLADRWVSGWMEVVDRWFVSLLVLVRGACLASWVTSGVFYVAFETRPHSDGELNLYLNLFVSSHLKSNQPRLLCVILLIKPNS